MYNSGSTLYPLPENFSFTKFQILSRAVPARADITPIARGPTPPTIFFFFSLFSFGVTNALRRAVGSGGFFENEITFPDLVVNATLLPRPENVFVLNTPASSANCFAFIIPEAIVPNYLIVLVV